METHTYIHWKENEINGTIVVIMMELNESQALWCGEQQGLLGNVVVQQLWMNEI